MACRSYVGSALLKEELSEFRVAGVLLQHLSIPLAVSSGSSPPTAHLLSASAIKHEGSVI
jgi:hypothetical protein